VLCKLKLKKKIQYPVHVHLFCCTTETNLGLDLGWTGSGL